MWLLAFLELSLIKLTLNLTISNCHKIKLLYTTIARFPFKESSVSKRFIVSFLEIQTEDFPGGQWLRLCAQGTGPLFSPSSGT